MSISTKPHAYDTIIPLILKQNIEVRRAMKSYFSKDTNASWDIQSPEQLAIALAWAIDHVVKENKKPIEQW